MTPAFWDASALVPLCVQEKSSAGFLRLVELHSVVVWWGTPVEIRSAFQRLRRVGQLTGPDYTTAGLRLNELRLSWSERQPSESLRAEAERLLISYSLKAGDALQLAAAVSWASGDSHSRTFIAGDAQLLEAARQIGFRTLIAD